MKFAQMNKMSCFLQSRSVVCGDSRGVSGLFCLLDRDAWIESHLASIHLSRESLPEKDLILTRAGFFDIEESVIEACLYTRSIDTQMRRNGVCRFIASTLHTKDSLVEDRR